MRGAAWACAATVWCVGTGVAGVAQDPEAQRALDGLIARYRAMDRYADVAAVTLTTVMPSDVGALRTVQEYPQEFAFARDGRGLVRTPTGGVAVNEGVVRKTSLDRATFSEEPKAEGETLGTLIGAQAGLGQQTGTPLLTLLTSEAGAPGSSLGEITEALGVLEEMHEGRAHRVISVMTKHRAPEWMAGAGGADAVSTPIPASIWVDSSSGLVSRVTMDATEMYRAVVAAWGGGEVERYDIEYTLSDVRLDAGVEDGAFVLDVSGREKVDDLGFGFAMGGENAAPVDARGAEFVHEPAPAFEATALSGEPVSIEGLRGRVVLLDFWATWCGPCVAAMPSVQRLSEEFADDGLVVVGINQDEADARAEVEAFLREKGVTFAQVLDPEDFVSEKFNVSAIPTTVLIDRQGVVQAYEVGFHGEGALREKLRRVLSGEQLEKPTPPRDPMESVVEVNAAAASTVSRQLGGSSWLMQRASEDGSRLAMPSDNGGLLMFDVTSGQTQSVALEGMTADRSITAFAAVPERFGATTGTGWVTAWSRGIGGGLMLSRFDSAGQERWTTIVGVEQGAETYFETKLAVADVGGDERVETVALVHVATMSDWEGGYLLAVVDDEGETLLLKKVALDGMMGLEVVPGSKGGKARCYLFGATRMTTVELDL